MLNYVITPFWGRPHGRPEVPRHLLVSFDGKLLASACGATAPVEGMLSIAEGLMCDECAVRAAQIA